MRVVHAVGEGSETPAAAVKGGGVAVDTDQAQVGVGLKKGFGMAAET